MGFWSSRNGSSLSRAETMDSVADYQYYHHEDSLEYMSFRTRLAYWRSTSTSGWLFDASDVVISTLSVILYVVYTYMTDGVHAQPDWMIGLEYAFTSFFAIHLVVALLSAKHMLRFVVTWPAMVDVLTILPITVVHAGTDFSLLIKLVRLLRVLRILHAKAAQRALSSEIKRQLFSIGFTLSCLTIVGASVTNVVENDQSLWPSDRELVDIKHTAGYAWFDCFWMCAITNLTVGYGDYVPITIPGRLTILAGLLMEFLLIPQQTNKLVEMLSKQSAWVRSSYTATASSTHIIVTGAVDSNGTDASGSGSTTAFFTEYFNEDHGNSQSRYAVVLNKGQPSREMQLLLAHPAYSLGLTYIDGTAMSGKDLARSAAAEAKAAFVLCNKFAEDIDGEDSATILRALSIKRYVFAETGRDIPVFVQLIRPENRSLFVITMMSHMNYAAAQLLAAEAVEERMEEAEHAYDAEMKAAGKRGGGVAAAGGSFVSKLRTLLTGTGGSVRPSLSPTAAAASGGADDRDLLPVGSPGGMVPVSSPLATTADAHAVPVAAAAAVGKVLVGAALTDSAAAALDDDVVVMDDNITSLTLVRSRTEASGPLPGYGDHVIPRLLSFVQRQPVVDSRGAAGRESRGCPPGSRGAAKIRLAALRATGLSIRNIERGALVAARTRNHAAAMSSHQLVAPQSSHTDDAAAHGESRGTLKIRAVAASQNSPTTPTAGFAGGPRGTSSPVVPIGRNSSRPAGDSAPRVLAASAATHPPAGAINGAAMFAPTRSAGRLAAPVSNSLKIQLPSAAALADNAVCIQELKLNLLAKSCLCPGLTTLIHNLVMSHNGWEDDGDVLGQEDGLVEWLDEYHAGCEYEIYRVPLSPEFEGISFTQAAQLVYTECNIVLFALELQLVGTPLSLGPRIVLNPGAYVLPGEPFKLFGFVIASDKKEADIVSSIGAQRKRRGSEHGSRTPSAPAAGAAWDTRTDAGAEIGLSAWDVGVGAREPQGSPAKQAPSGRRMSYGEADAGVRAVASSNIKAGIDSLKAARAQATVRRLSDETHNSLRIAPVVPGRGMAAAPLPSSTVGRGQQEATTTARARAPMPVFAPSSEAVASVGLAGQRVADSTQQGHSRTGSITHLPMLFPSAAAAQQQAVHPVSAPAAASIVGAGSSHRHAPAPRASSSRNVFPAGPLRNRFSGGSSRFAALQEAKAANGGSDEGASGGGLGSNSARVEDMGSYVERALRTGVIQRHIIVCTCDYSNLTSFIAPLRGEYLAEHLPIVIIHPVPPTSFQWSKTLMFEDVFYMQGNPFEANDLIRAGVMTASSVVLFAISASSISNSSLIVRSRGGGSGDSDAMDGTTGDAMYICIYRLVRTLNPAVDIVCEIAATTNVSYLAYSGQLGSTNDNEVYSSPPFAAGHVFTPAVLDILLVQAFYNPHLITILTHLLSGGLNEAARHKTWSDRATALGHGPALSGLQDAQMHLVSVPPQWVGRSYGELVDDFALRLSTICFGLRRGNGPLRHHSQAAGDGGSRQEAESGLPGAGDGEESHGLDIAAQLRSGMLYEDHNTANADQLRNCMPYVYTNPKRPTMLADGDAVFVLSPVDPSLLKLRREKEPIAPSVQPPRAEEAGTSTSRGGPRIPVRGIESARLEARQIDPQQVAPPGSGGRDRRHSRGEVLPSLKPAIGGVLRGTAGEAAGPPSSPRDKSPDHLPGEATRALAAGPVPRGSSRA